MSCPFLEKTLLLSNNMMGFPDVSVVKNPPAMQETPQLDSREGKIPWRRDRLLTPVFLGFPDGSNGKEHACSAGDLGWEDPLEKGMATHSSILAWRIPRTE